MIRILKKTNLLIIAVTAILFTGCSPKNIAYFQDMDESAILTENTASKQIKIKPNDKLSIVVKSKDTELASLFNLQTFSSQNAQRHNEVTETRNYSYQNNTQLYTVDPKGDIDFPILGTLHVAGMTRSELAGFIKGELMGRGLLKDPVVIVEFYNTGISVLGEVNTPGRFDLNRDNITILEALALAGDMTIQGQRENVKVIREENGERKIYILDLTKGNELMKSPAFYLQQNDVVYVEPNNIKKRQSTANGNVVLQASFWVSVASLLTSIAVLIFK